MIVYTLDFDMDAVAGSNPGDPDRQAAQTVSIKIYDLETAGDPVEYPTALTPAGNPLDISTINNDEDVFQPIQSKQAKIRFKADQSQGLDLDIFSDAYDNQFKVEITVAGTPNFHGFLMLPDAQMPFQPDPQIVELTASDHLPLLKDIAVTNLDGTPLSGKYRIIELIAIILKSTGLDRFINVINNLRPGFGQQAVEAGFVTDGTTHVISLQDFDNIFTIGQQITLSGTASNDGTYTIIGMLFTFGTLFLQVVEPVTAGLPAPATLIDPTSDNSYYENTSVDAKMLEASPGVSVDGYSALGFLLQDDATLCQYKSEWWIKRIDEYDNNNLYVVVYDAFGVKQSGPDIIDLNYSIGFAQNVLFANADQIRRSDRPKKYVKETLNYELPAEIICNSDFSRGDFIADLPNENVDGIDLNAKSYVADCWSLHRYSGGSPTSTLYIKKLFKDGYEKERYLVVTPASTSSETTWAQSQPIPVEIKDKASITVEYSTVSDFGAGEGMVTYAIVFLFIIANNGDYWYWSNIDEIGNPTDYRWVGPFASETNRAVYEGWILDDVDERDPRTLTVDMTAFPATGNLYIGLPQFNQTGSSFDNSVIIQYNINFDYIPFINGSYQKYSGHTNTVTRTATGYAAKREQTVYMGDAPKPIMKPAMFIQVGSGYVVTNNFYPAAKFALGAPTLDQVKPFGWHQAFGVWNQHKQATRIFTGSLQGLGADWPDLMHRYVLTDSNPNTDDRYFLLISFQQDFRTSSWRATFIECYNSTVGRTYDDPEEFKYITGG